MELRDAVAFSLAPDAWRAAAGGMLAHARDRDSGPSLERLLRAAGTSRSISHRARALRTRADEVLSRASALGIEAIGWLDARYPAALAAIPDPPPILWIRGLPDAVSRPSVAIVGSRAASPYALEVAGRLGTELAARDVTVVSGLARGVDSAAHRGALADGGRTVAVLGSGADIIYPAEHTRLAAEIAVNGAVVSELPPGTPPRAFHFPLRNRIISGLSLAVVVVEASERSGSLITAASALDQGRDVMAVPGNVLTGRNAGSHALLKDGAKVVETADDIWEELVLPLAGGSGRGDTAGRGTEPADPVLRSMEAGEAYDLDALEERSGVGAVKLLPRLLELELRGAVRRVGGGRFVRSGQTCYRT